MGSSVNYETKAICSGHSIQLVLDVTEWLNPMIEQTVPGDIIKAITHSKRLGWDVGLLWLDVATLVASLSKIYSTGGK